MKAFKDWSHIVHALGTGTQALILRKGGIHEDGGSFELEAQEFLLLPTLFHQAEEKIKKGSITIDEDVYQQDQLNVEVRYMAKVEGFVEVTDIKALRKLEELHIWTEEVVMERFNRWNPNKVYCMILRVYQLSQPLIVEMTPEMAGCKSWVDVDGTNNLVYKPVLNDSEFQAVKEKIEVALA